MSDQRVAGRAPKLASQPQRISSRAGSLNRLIAAHALAGALGTESVAAARAAVRRAVLARGAA